MNIQGIITNPPRDEYLDNRVANFDQEDPVANIGKLHLKKAATSDAIYYGLFDADDRLVGYLELWNYGYDGIWQVSLVQLANVYKGQGYGTFLYDYAIMNDQLKLLSDETNTGGPHGSKGFWINMYEKKRYNIVGFDTETNTVLPNIHPNEVYNEKPNIRWLALPPGKTINEALEAMQRNMKGRYVVWYGPGTTTPEYFNF